MPDVTFTDSDILSAGEFDAGWYPMAAKEVNEGPGTKDPSSTTWACQFEVIDGARKGALIDHWFSNKMMKNVIQYIKCFVSNIQAGTTYPLDQTKNKPVMGYVVYDLDRNANTIKAFKPVGK